MEKLLNKSTFKTGGEQKFLLNSETSVADENINDKGTRGLKKTLYAYNPRIGETEKYSTDENSIT